MTYKKNGNGASPLVGAGFSEIEFVEAGTVHLVSVVTGGPVIPGQRAGRAASAFSGGALAARLQEATLEWSGMSQEPIVRFTGVCSRPYVRNVTAGKEMLVRVDLALGQTLEIDMATHTVRRDGDMVWGYTGRWFSVKPGDEMLTGADGIGSGFSAEVDLRETGVRARGTSGAGVLSLFGSGVAE